MNNMKSLRYSLPGLLLLTTVFFYSPFYAQNNVGLGTNMPHSSAALDITATDKGMLVPRMTSSQRAGIATPANLSLIHI